ncbi:hypothetical protein HNR53_001697 [Bacillus benzoevorans]|uniref:Uncharacterized protein n=1 Tax=Bacillus benzoevorans TaxID=1456 RepID=A0A7X0HQI7_9BACI|nr:hypothetical protein [Bacillus benzoevorans]
MIDHTPRKAWLPESVPVPGSIGSWIAGIG